MFLAHLIADSEDLLICDFAQYYHILDYYNLQPSLAATLAMGLSDDSRIKKKLAGVNATLDQLLLALLIDDFNMFLYSRSKHKGAKPKKIFKVLSEPQKPKDELMSFSTPDDYEAWRRRKEEQWSKCQK